MGARRKRKVPKKRSVPAHSLTDPRFKQRVIRNKKKDRKVKKDESCYSRY